MSEKWENIIWGESLDVIKREVAESYRRRAIPTSVEFKPDDIARHLVYLLRVADERGLSLEMLLSDYMINHEKRFK